MRKGNKVRRLSWLRIVANVRMIPKNSVSIWVVNWTLSYRVRKLNK